MNAQPQFRGLPRPFWYLLAGMFVNRAGGFVGPFLTLYLVDQRHVGMKEAGSIIALLGIGSLGSGPAAGFVSDHWGRRAALALSTIGGAASMLALGLTQSSAAIALAALAAGFFGEMYRTPCQAMVADIVPPAERERAFGLIYWAVNVGFAIAPAAAGLLASLGYSALFVGDAGTTLLFGMAVVLLVPETRPDRPPEAHRAREYLAPYTNRLFLAFCLSVSLVQMMFHQVGVTLPLDMQAHAVSPEDYGRMLSLNGVLITVFQPFVSRYTRRAPRVHVLTLAAAIVGSGLSLNAVAAGSIPLYVASIIIWTSGEIIMAGTTPAIITEMAPAHLRGTYQGAFTLTTGMAMALASVGGCALLERFGSHALWGTCFVAGLLSALGYRLTVSRHTRRMLAGAAPSPAPAP